MKICVISTGVFQLGMTGAVGYSGLEHLAWQTAKGLAEKGHEVSLIAPEGSTCPGAKIISCGPAGQWDEKKSYRGYWKELLNFDVIIDHTWNKWSTILQLEGVLKCPVLKVCHAPVNTMFQSLPALEKPCFVCISQDQANHFEALFSHEARVCHNGIDLSHYAPIAGIKRSDRFLFLARFSTIKGPDICIEACLKAGVGLDLVGDTSITNEPELLKKCQSMADGKQIKIVGPATRGECVWWFSQAHCLVHPVKRFREPLGLAPLEAAACGCPCISWRNGAMKETIQDGITGLLVDSFDQLVDTIKAWAKMDLDTRDSFHPSVRDMCRTWAKNWTVEKMVTRYEELCQEATATGGW